jgi:hypothetical protein
MVYNVQMDDGRAVLIHAGNYRHEDGKHIFESARILPPPRLDSQAESSLAAVMSFVDSEVKQVEGVHPSPPVAEPIPGHPEPLGPRSIRRNLLIESLEAESDDQFRAAIEDMICRTYGSRPDWLKFWVGARFIFRERHFREVLCQPENATLMLMQHATRNEGLGRAIIRREDDGAFEIRAGGESFFNSDELQPAQYRAGVNQRDNFTGENEGN